MNRPIRPNRPGLQGSSRNTALLAGGGTLFELKAAPDTTTSTALTWNEAVPKPDNYRVERSLNGTTFSTVTTLANTDFSYTDTGRTESVQYWYRIVPILGGVDQPASNVADTWTVPATPTGLTATAISSTQIDLAWTDVSTGNTAQSIQRRSPAGSGSYSFIASVGATANSYSDTGLIAATQYEYQVAATNPATQSAWSTAANATTTGGGPPSPSWTLDFSTGEPWSNGTNYVFSSLASTTRTFVNSSGYVAPCVANLAQYSAEFENAYWNGGTGTTAAGVTSPTAPDNSTNARELKETTANSGHWRQRNSISLTAGTVTWSAYVKKQSRQYVGIYVYTFNNQYGAIFDLNNNAAFSAARSVGTPNGSYGSENVGNGWYRIWVTMGTGGSGTVNTYPSVFLSDRAGFTGTLSDGIPVYTGSTSESVYVWGLQCVEGSAPLPYSATTTSSNGIPRLTHNSSGQRLGLLVEEQRANLFQRSGELTNAYWNLNAVTTATVSVPVAPDNSTNAVEVKETTANSSHDIGRGSGGVVVSTNTTYSVSVFLKKNNRQYCGVYAVTLGPNTSISALFDLDNGTLADSATVGTPNATTAIENYGNGWYRCTVTMTTPSTVSSNQMYPGFYLSDRATLTGSIGTFKVPQYAGSTSNSVYIWGAQLEAGATVSSYIPTVASSVTRQADIAYVETADVTNWGRPGSFVVEYYKPLEQSGGVVVADDDGAGNAGRLGLQYSAGGPRIVYGTSGSGSGGTDTAGLNKIGWAWNGSGAATRSALNGSALDTSLATSFDPTLTDGINLGGNIDWSTLPLTVSGQPNVVIRKVQFYNSQLSAADLNTLTGPTSYTVDALVVAGGGGGGRGTAGFGAGGGGAGGYRTATGFSLTPGTSYTITVGAGGAFNTSGSNSVFSTITSTGGGRGGESQGSTPVDGASGGSGGGGGKPTTTNTAGAGGAGTSGQGNNGGAAFNGTNADPNLQGGGGGGSGGTGGTGTSTQAGHGGTGTSSSITGTATTYAIGGGGGTYQQTPGDGDTSDGSGKGAKHTTSAAATAGRVNRGNGGGGGTGSTNVGGSGGSGVVILRMPTARYSGVHTPATVTTSGSDTILTFTSSGNYVA